ALEPGGEEPWDGARRSEPLTESVSLGYGETALRVALGDCRLAPQSVENRGIVPSVSVRVRMPARVGAFKRGGHARNRLVDLAKNPEPPRHADHHGPSAIPPAYPAHHPASLLTSP